MNRRGEVIAQHVVLPLHIGAFPACCAAVLRDYDDIAEGDAFLINHPYEGGSPHAPDMAVLTPVFFEGECIGFGGSIAHKSDIGGPVPGSCSGQAKEIFNEGLHLPAVRYQRGFQRNIEIERIIGANSRTPELVLGDIRGQLGAARLGEQRLGELVRKFGRDQALASFARLMELSERRDARRHRRMARRALRGRTFRRRRRHRSEQPVRIHVVVEKHGRPHPFDFSGSADQTKGPANISPPTVKAAIAYCLIALVDPHIFINSGVLNAFEVTLREGSVMNPRFPAPVNTYNPTVHATVEAMFAALTHIVPSQGARRRLWQPLDHPRRPQPPRPARPMCNTRFSAAAAGARSKDGTSGTSVNQSNAKIAPIEIIESEFPTRILRFELIARLRAVPGKFRGGLGIRREYLNLAGRPLLDPFDQTRHRAPGRGRRWQRPHRRHHHQSRR